MQKSNIFGYILYGSPKDERRRWGFNNALLRRKRGGQKWAAAANFRVLPEILTDARRGSSLRWIGVGKREKKREKAPSSDLACLSVIGGLGEPREGKEKNRKKLLAFLIGLRKRLSRSSARGISGEA